MTTLEGSINNGKHIRYVVRVGSSSTFNVEKMRHYTEEIVGVLGEGSFDEDKRQQ